MIKVAITRTEDDFYGAFNRAIADISNDVVNPGDRVLIKPNLVMQSDPESGQITNPHLVEAVARYCLDQGAARVIIGEGPSYYQPESSLRECFTRSGISAVADRLGIEWVLFDEHDYRVYRNISNYTPNEFRVTEFAFNCDRFINIPVLKTHYLTTVTLAMKNLKGCLKREDKPRFHHPDLSCAVVELNKIVRPTINVIDCTPVAVMRRLNTGYRAEGKRLTSGLIIVSEDIVATDAVGCALMDIDPQKVRTVILGATAGLGESDLTRIDIIGEELKRLKFKVELPQEQLQRNFPLLEISGAERACSGCIIPLLSSLLALNEQGARLDKLLGICLGKEPSISGNKEWLLIGNCAQIQGRNDLEWVIGCPPNRVEILEELKKHISC